MTLNASAAVQFSGGDGSPGDPYQIADVCDLQNMNLDTAAHYILVNDIDARETRTWNWNGTLFLGFEPIGNDTNIFEGKFNGNGYEISNLYINRPTDDHVGLFGYLGTESSVWNVDLINCSVIGNNNTGGLAGRNSGSIAICYSNGTVSGNFNVGGMVGYNYGSGILAAAITECYTNVSVNASGNDIGGFVGYNYWNGAIESCFSTGTVKGVSWIGGFVGVNEGNIEMCYSTCPVSGSTAGGFVGVRGAWIGDCFWDINTSGLTQAAGSGSSAGINGRNTDDMVRESTFTPANWDFYSTWIMADGSTRPYLRAFGGDGTQDYPYIVTDVVELQDINSNLSAHYILGCDIDAAATAVWNSGAGFLPLGNLMQPFTGKFHGNGYGICGATINRPSTDYIGLFGCIGPGGVISCVSMVDANITGNNFTGGLAGYNNGSIITSSRTSGTLSGNIQVGGLVGANHGAVNNSYSTCKVTGIQISGGLIGYNNGSVNTTYSAGFVPGSDTTIGGLVGNNTGSVINSFWDNETSGQSVSDGGAGRNTTGMMDLSTFTGTGWNFTSVWDIDNGQGYPWLRTERIWFMIYNLDDLQNMTKDLDRKYRLANDIDCTTSKSWNGGAGFLPIGNASSPFSGMLDGNGFKISGLWINRSYADYVGLFGYTKAKCAIINIILESINVSGASNVGGLAGYCKGRTVDCCRVNGSVTAAGDNAGGLIGYNKLCSVTGSSSTVSVKGMNATGGLIGRNDDGMVEDCFGKNSVYGVHYVGGLIGYNRGTTRSTSISNCSSTGPVNGENFTGGLVGYNYFSGDGGSYEYQYILNSYSTSDVACAGNYSGGLVGYLEDIINGLGATKILNSYGSGNVNGKSYTGGLIGGAVGISQERTTISNCSYQGPGPEGEGKYAGGLVGYADYINFKNCNSITSGMDLESKVDYVGGLIGYFDHGTIENCWSKYTDFYITGNKYVGGLVGYTDSHAVIKSSFSTAGIYGNSTLGGLVGYNGGEILNSYSATRWAIFGYAPSDYIGGLVGQSNGIITHCYSMSLVGGSGLVGGLVAFASGPVTDSFWDTETSMQSGSGGGTGKTTAEMKQQSTFVDAGWDFDELWWLYHGRTYPWLQWEKEEPFAVYDSHDLQNMRNNLDGSFRLACDIAAVDTSAWNNGSGFEPIGNTTKPFTGTFDGNGYNIRNLTINRSEEDQVGLFGSTSTDAFIENVIVSSLNVTGAVNVGGLVGANMGTISGCLISGTVTGLSNVGGMVGDNNKGSINACTSHHTFTGTEVSMEGQAGFWKMDEASWNGTAGEVMDASGNNNNGTAHNGINTTASGKFDRCGDFDGIDDYVHCGDDASLGPVSAITVEAWVCFDSISGSFPQIVSRGNQIEGWNLYSYSGGNYEFSFIVLESGGSWGDAWALGATIPQPDIWYHVVGTYDGSSVRIYVNGSLDGEDSSVSGMGIDYAGFTTSYIGRKGSGNYFNGRIDEVAVYNRSLAPEEVRVRYEVTRNIGGLVGNNSGEITTCSSSGITSGIDTIGGLVGNNEGLISDSYSTAKVEGLYTSGGLAGINRNPGMIDSCYSTGMVKGITRVGGLVGNTTSPVERSFWDNITSGHITSAGGNGKNTTEMMRKITFSNADWDFIDIWRIINNFTYPFFKWQSCNYAPWITTTNVEIAREDNEYSVQYSAAYLDYEPLYWGMTTNATWLFFNTTTIVLNGTPANEDVGTYWVNITLEDFFGHTVFTNFTIKVQNTNDIPIITSTPILTATEDQLYTYDVNATDDDLIYGDILTYSLTTAPANMTIDGATGVITWTPVNEQVGDNDVLVQVTDSVLDIKTQAFTVTVSDVNDGPYFISIPKTTATEDELYTYDVDATDDDLIHGDVLKYDLTTHPNGMTIDETSGVITWTPANDQVGNHNVVVRVSDVAGEFETQVFTIVVANVNDNPVMNKTGIPTSAMEDELYSYDFDADDIDPTNDVLTWHLDTNGDDWLIIAGTSGLLSGTPSNDHADRTFRVNVSVSDGNDGIDWFNFTIYVNNVNDDPKITTSDVESVQEGELYYVDYTATDIDPTADTLTWDLETNASDWLSIDKTTGVLSGTPGENDTGSFWVKVMVSDGKGGADSHNFTLSVKAKPGPPPVTNKNPVITTEDVTTAKVNESYYVDYEATDDRTPATNLTWSYDSNASWLSFDHDTGVLSGTPVLSDVGTYWVKISVGDGEGGFDYSNFTITVPGSYIPPEPEPKNNRPKLSEGKMTPASGDTETEFTFSVHYFDEDGDAPASINVVIDSTAYAMTKKDGENASDGIYEYKTTLTEGNHEYYFAANDSKEEAEPGDTTPTTAEDAFTTPEIIKAEPEEKEEEEEGVNWLLFLIPIIIIIIVILLVIMIRKKPEGETEEEEE